MKKLARYLTLTLVFVLMMSSYTFTASATAITPYYNNTSTATTAASVSGAGLLSITNRFTGFPSLTTHAVIKTYVEKKFLGLFWNSVDIGQPNNEWVDTIYDYTYVGGHTFQLTSTGTYRVTAVYTIYGSGGDPDVITCQSTVVY